MARARRSTQRNAGILGLILATGGGAARCADAVGPQLLFSERVTAYTVATARETIATDTCWIVVAPASQPVRARCDWRADRGALRFHDLAGTFLTLGLRQIDVDATLCLNADLREGHYWDRVLRDAVPFRLRNWLEANAAPTEAVHASTRRDAARVGWYWPPAAPDDHEPARAPARATTVSAPDFALAGVWLREEAGDVAPGELPALAAARRAGAARYEASMAVLRTERSAPPRECAPR